MDGLSIADASLFPDLPAADTNIPVIAVAEHLVKLRGRLAHGVAE